MGVGASLALGLIKGFTKNIEREREAREADSVQLSNLETLVADNALKGNIYNADAISGIIKDARGKLNDKERIDLFGTATPRVRVDLSELGPLVSKPSKQTDVISYFDGGLSFKRTDSPDSIMRTFNSFFANSSNQQKFMTAPLQVKQEIMGHFYPIQGSVARRAVIDSQGNYNKEVDVGQFAESELQGMWFLEQFGKNSPELFKVGSGTNITKPSESTGLSSSQRISVEAAIAAATERGDNFTSMGLGSGNPNDNAYNPLLVLDTDLYAQGIRAVTSSLGEELPTALAAWQNIYSTKLGFSLQQSKEAFEAAVMFANMSVNELQQPIDPASFDPQNGLQFISAETISPILKKLYRAGITSVGQIGLVLAPYMQYTPPAVGKPSKGTRTTASSESLRKYILRTEMGVDTSDDKNVADAFETYKNHAEGVIETNKALKLLYTEVANAKRIEGDPQSLLLFYDNLETIFDLKEGILGGLLSKGAEFFTRDDNQVKITNDSGRAEDADVTNNKELTSSYSAKLSQRVRDAGKGISDTKEREAAQRIEAMKITLAFKMARADDPSGRLSNQDIEAQYIKLGRAFSTRGQELAALDVTLADYARKAQKFEPILALLKKGADEVTNAAEFQLVDGIIAANTMILSQEIEDMTGGQDVSISKAGGLTAEDFQGADFSGIYPNLRMTLNSDGIPVYYNERTGNVSTNPKDLLDSNVQQPVQQSSNNTNQNVNATDDANQNTGAGTGATQEFSGDTHNVKLGAGGSPMGDDINGYVIENSQTKQTESGRWLFIDGKWVAKGK